MGFNVNLNNNKPTIQAAQSSQDGGAGNLGYFEQGHEEKERQQNQNNSVFLSESEPDTFSKESEADNSVEGFSISKIIANVLFKIKTLLKIN